MPERPRFPRLQWAVLVFVAVWIPSYARAYDATNFLNLCDISVILAVVGIWTGSALLLSSQLIGALVVDFAWGLDVAWRAATGKHLLGGTEYMWDPQYPLWLRAISYFHVVWPPMLFLVVRRLGYDPRGLALQAGIAALALVASRFVAPELNLNYAHRDVLFGRAWGPAPVHLLVTWMALVGLVYWPTHRLLKALLPPRTAPSA